jgi:DNA-binding transcriptional ArsR family regulator
VTPTPTAASGHAHLRPVDPQRVTAARARLLSPGDATRLASLLGLLADPVRARILYALDLVEELCVGDLAIALDASQDAIGYGLRLLRTAGLVVNRRAGRVVYYRLADNFPQPLREHCLRRLIELSRTDHGDEESAGPAPAAHDVVPTPARERERGRAEADDLERG